MGNPQDQNAQDLILDAHHDASVADSVSPQGDCPGTASGAPQWCPERARIIHHREALAQKLRDAVSNLPVEAAQILQRPSVEFNPPDRRRTAGTSTGRTARKVFQCTQCDRTDDADVNAARVMQQRARRWLELRKSGRQRPRGERGAVGGAESRSQGIGTMGCGPGGDSQARGRGQEHQDAQRRRGCGVDSASGCRPTAESTR